MPHPSAQSGEISRSVPYPDTPEILPPSEAGSCDSSLESLAGLGHACKGSRNNNSIVCLVSRTAHRSITKTTNIIWTNADAEYSVLVTWLRLNRDYSAKTLAAQLRAQKIATMPELMLSLGTKAEPAASTSASSASPAKGGASAARASAEK